MSDKYLSINGKLMTIDNKLIKLPSGCIDPLSENLVDTNTELVNQNKALVEDIETLVGGISIDPTLQEKTVTPTTEQQVVTPDAGNDGLSKVTVNAVTSSIDSNITPENIKKDVSILGVTGTYEGDTSNITTVKKLLDAKKIANNLFDDYKGTSVDNLIAYDDTSKVTNMSYMFAYCPNLTTIPQLDTSKVTNMNYMFARCSRLTEIHMTGMKASFDISASTKFTREALVEIINNCATVTSTKTLTIGSINLAKLTEEDQQIATNKGWALK